MEDECPTYYLVCLLGRCSQEAADFIAAVLAGKPENGGAGLQARQEAMDGSGLVIHVSATRKRLFEVAEAVGMKKLDSSCNVVREFRADEAETFGETGIVGPLTIADVQKCVLHAMESVHFDEARTTRLPGHESTTVMKRSPILAAYRRAGLVDAFPLHDEEGLEKVYAAWRGSPLLNPPVDSIRNYFGENVALYVSFTAFYTRFLVPAALLGVLQFVLDRLLVGRGHHNTVLFALTNLVLVTLFLETWKRRSNGHAHDWGTGGKLRRKQPRAEFRGDRGRNPITGKPEVQYPKNKTVKKMLFVSVPLTFVCLVAAFALMLLSFEVEAWVVDRSRFLGAWLAHPLGLAPSVAYSLLVYVMNLRYLQLARRLTEWENHRTEEQFERHVVAKLVLFEFVNSFVAMFYIAFYLADVVLLKSQVFTMLIVQQVANQVQETVLPVLMRKPSARRMFDKVSKRIDDGDAKGGKDVVGHGEVSALTRLASDSAQLSRAAFTLRKEPYESTYDDFVEIWLQFGGVFLFSCVYPLAALLALANNLVELKMDAYKLCKFARKPTPRSVRDIGAWYTAFNLTSLIAIVTNCALLAMDVDLRRAFGFALSDVNWILLFVGLEHVFLAIRMAIDQLIPDTSTEVKRLIDREDFVLKNQRQNKVGGES